MSTSPGSGPLWWDREVDFSSGRKLRADVRATAQKIWPLAVSHSQRKLGDGWYATDLLEYSVSQISRHLDGKQVPVFANDISRLLMRAFSFALKRKLGKCSRLQLVDDPESLDTFFESKDLYGPIHSRLDVSKYRDQMSDLAWQIFWLRDEKWSWREIGVVVEMSAEAVKKTYYRELRRIREQFTLSSPRSQE